MPNYKATHAKGLFSLLCSTSVICPKNWKFQKTYTASVPAAGGVLRWGCGCCQGAHSLGGRKGEASHFPLLLEWPPFSHFQRQGLLTGCMREEKSPCAGDGRKRSQTFLVLFLATDLVTFSVSLPGGTALPVFITFSHVLALQLRVLSHFLCPSFLLY